MNIALIHDYLNEFGGAERVLEALTELYPDAPIYTSFYRPGSQAYERFRNREIHTSWVHVIPFFSTKLHSPLRFLAPLIWGSFDFSTYDIVISSAGWYVTKGFGTRGNNKKKPVEICYCHTPPRWLYGYTTSIEYQKYWPVKLYAAIVGHFMRMYDYKAAQRVNYFVANSEEIAARIKKFYRREANVIYPPVSLSEVPKHPESSSGRQLMVKNKDYYFMVARLVGSKGLELAVEAAAKGGFKLKIAGVSGGYYSGLAKLSQKAQKNVEFLGFVSDEELVQLYSDAKGFLALAQDEDFGITPVEAQMAGTGVVAFNGGGYKETIVDGETGVLFDDYSPHGLLTALQRFEKAKISSEACKKNAARFSKERFQKEMKRFVDGVMKDA